MLTVRTSTPPRRKISIGARPSISSKPSAKNSYTILLFIFFGFLLNTFQIALNGIFQAHIQGIAYQRMTDADLVGPRDALMKIGPIDETESVTGTRSQPHLACGLCSLHKWGDGLFSVNRISGSIRFRIKFNTFGTSFGGILHHLGIRIHEHRCTDNFFVKPADDICQKSEVCLCVPSMIGCYLVFSIGHECHLSRFHPQHQFYKFIDRITFNVEFGSQQRLQVEYILIANMAFVWAGMNSNALRTERFAVQSHFEHIGVISPTCITDSSNLVDVYT